MLQPYRSDFNRRFSAAKYDHLRRELNRSSRTEIQFRVCETPCFFPRSLMDELAAAGSELTRSTAGQSVYMDGFRQAVPAAYRVPGDSPHPNFMTVDFGFVRSSDGSLTPKLVELQAFPSIFGYQDVLSRQYVESFQLDSNLDWLLGRPQRRELLEAVGKGHPWRSRS